MKSKNILTLILLVTSNSTIMCGPIALSNCNKDLNKCRKELTQCKKDLAKANKTIERSNKTIEHLELQSIQAFQDQQIIPQMTSTISWLQNQLNSFIPQAGSSFTVACGTVVLLGPIAEQNGTAPNPNAITGYTFIGNNTPAGAELQLVQTISSNPGAMGSGALNYYTLTVPADFVGTVQIGYQTLEPSKLESKSVYTITFQKERVNE